MVNPGSESDITLLIATRNAHKVQEICDLLSNSIRPLTLNDLPAAPTVSEDANTFAGNAAKKARELAHWLVHRPPAPLGELDRFFVLADDSGLEVDALNGSPGVHSARFAALQTIEGKSAGTAQNNSPDAANNEKLLRLLEAVPWDKRTARFRCVLALVSVQPISAGLNPELFDGACEGHIGFAAKGKHGFGYDPLFIPLGHETSFAELGDAEKNKISHRAQALAKLRTRLFPAASP